MKTTNATIRWMLRADMPRVLQIENESFRLPWCEQDFLSEIRRSNIIGAVAEAEGQVAGFMIYELHPKSLQIINFAVAAEFQRERIATQMIERMKTKISIQRRTSIFAEVHESFLGAQCFLRSQGFLATGIQQSEYFGESYRMEFSLNVFPKNRLAQFFRGNQ